MSHSDGGTTDVPQRSSHLQRLSLIFLVAGGTMLAAGFAIQWLVYHGNMSGRGFDPGITSALLVQLLISVGTVALTGAAFGYLLMAMRADTLERAAGETGVQGVDGIG
jgi:hypothetical protein